jgi:protein SCO1
MNRWAMNLWRVCLAAALVLTTTHARADSPVDAVGVEEHVGTRIPLDLTLRDTRGKTVRLRDYFDGEQPVLLVLAYSRCTTLCNLVLRGVARSVRGMDAVAGRDFRIVTVSIDPQETAARAAEHEGHLLAAIDATDPRAWSFLTGREESIRALAASLGFKYTYDARTRQWAHPSVVFALAPDGRVRRYLYGFEFPAAEMTDALTKGGAGPTPGGILRCFRFDAASRRYGRAVALTLQIGAFTVLAGVVLLIVTSQRRGRRRA